ncbi:MAG TPA: tRNA (adenosine(37)-N6)-threonylcarbamoyltransferase complex dimerization subunit type 1 TsaB [Steroidobacteraceae bacterium]
MRVLAIDTATEACSVALLSGAETISRSALSGRSHARQILGMVDAVLAEGQVSLAMLDGIAASIGPGAFTGVRISVAVAQGLAFGADLRVAAITTLEALAAQAWHGGAVMACLDARMGEVYWGCFTPDPGRGVRAISPAAVAPPHRVVLPAPGSYRGVGRGFAAHPVLAALPGLSLNAADSQALPNAREFALLGALRLELGEGLDPADLIPLYLRDKVASTEAERRRQPAP